jgi:hypothetical protein
MKQYLLSVIYPEGATVPSAPALEKIMRDVTAVRDEMKSAGAWVFAAGLHPASTATMVKIENGQTLTTDGPFAETKEQVGGFTVINAADLDAALEWGRKLARATTTPIEVRPIQQHDVHS